MFSQQPNVLAGDGCLIIFPFDFETAGAILTASAAVVGSGYSVNEIVTVGGAGTGGSVKVTKIDSNGAIIDFEIYTRGSTYAVASSITTTNTGGGTGFRINVLTVSNSAESITQAVARVNDLIYFNGIISTVYPASGNMKTTADAIQSYGNKMLILPSADVNDVDGAFTDIKDAADTETRCLLYTLSALEARLFAAATAGRGFSTNFAGSNTTITLNLKQLATIDADTGITQTIYEACKVAGVDVYVSYNGFSGYVSNGANKYFDEVYNLIWLVGQLQVSGFNALALVGTKVPQTESGVAVLKGAYRNVLAQAVSNQYCAPGTWTSPNTFGNQIDFLANIQQYGFYIYSQPVSQQSPSDRADRKAPLIQISLKESGAIQSSDVIVNINP